MSRVIPLRPAPTPAERLLAMEFEEGFLGERMHRDRVRRTALRDAMLRARVSLSAEDVDQYERLRAIKGGKC